MRPEASANRLQLQGNQEPLGPCPPAEAAPGADAFYAECLRQLLLSKIPFLLGGTFAVSAYVGDPPPTKDLDVFCRAGDYPRILSHFRKLHYQTEVEDERWLAKIRKQDFQLDVIFNSTVAVVPVVDQWFANACTIRLFDQDVPILSPTELIWSKVFVQDRYRYDGSHVAHIILKTCEQIDWRRLLSYMEQYWEVLLVHLLNFQFIYPTERKRLPAWLMAELLRRLQEQTDLPVPRMKICRGRLFSRGDYWVDIAKWGFADLIGEGDKTDGSA
jgi:hypothetical protein